MSFKKLLEPLREAWSDDVKLPTVEALREEGEVVHHA
jgi:hypothetical protein